MQNIRLRQRREDTDAGRRHTRAASYSAELQGVFEKRRTFRGINNIEYVGVQELRCLQSARLSTATRRDGIARFEILAMIDRSREIAYARAGLGG